MTRRIQIVVVDDDPIVSSTMCDTLERAGYETITARNGEDALKLLHKHCPSLIVCDLIMPVMDGVATIREVRARNYQIPVIAMSGGSRSSVGPTLEDALRVGADALLEKPFGARALLEAVRALVETDAQESA